MYSRTKCSCRIFRNIPMELLHIIRLKAPQTSFLLPLLSSRGRRKEREAMKTLAELDRLEAFARDSGLRNGELQAAFADLPRYPEPAPLVKDLESVAYQYCEAVRRYLLGRDHPDFIDEQRMFSIMSAKSVIVPWGKTPEGWLA